MKDFLTFFSFFVLVAPVLVFAQYKPLVGIPGVSDTQNFDQYLQAIYATAISLAALLAVIKIVIAGVKWMTTEIVSSKGDAKKDIQGAVFGLIIILGAVLILNIVNPNIGTVNLSFNSPPRQAVSSDLILNAEVRACNTNPDTCKFDMIGCKPLKNQYGRVDPGKFDCGSVISACLGKSTVSKTSEKGDPMEIACLSHDADKNAALITVASAKCAAGDSCTAAVCENNFFSCANTCTDSGGIYDKATNACVTSSIIQLASNQAEIDTALAAADLGGRAVNDATIVNGFNSTTGATQTYHLFELPSNKAYPARRSATPNSSVLRAAREVCSLTARSESIKAGSPGLGSEITITQLTIGDKRYAGCTR
jgi:type IV secretory pathway VirB2 component (pilin)